MKKILSLISLLVWLAPLGRAQDAEPPPPLPPASTLTVVASTDYNWEGDFHPEKVGTDFPVILPKIYVTLSTSAENVTFAFSARLVADEVKGLAHGKVIVPEGNLAVAEITPDKKQNYVEVPFPAAGLLPGRYRIEIVDNSPAARVATSIAVTTYPPALPAADSLEVTLRKGDLVHDFDDSLEPSTDFPSWPGKIYVTVKGPADVSLGFTTRVTVVDVPGLPAGAILGGSDTGEISVATLSADYPTATAGLIFPRLGLPAGKYQVELVEGNALQRVVKTVPFTTHAAELSEPEFNLADAEMGGLMESVSGEAGAGYTFAPLLLLRDNRKPWTPVGPPTPDVDFDHLPAPLPCELVVSFFQREAALVSAVELMSRDAEGKLPQDVEIWGSTQSATEGFTRLAAVTLEAGKPSARIEVPPTSVKFLKVRILSVSEVDSPLALVGLKVWEGKANGYVALAKRLPAVLDWKLQPRHAAQGGLYFLQPTATRWQMDSACLGCHVQSETLMGISVARQNGYVISGLAEAYINDLAFQCQNPDGGIARTVSNKGQAVETADSLFSALAMAYGPHATPERGNQLVLAATYLAGFQIEDGTISSVGSRAPIEQGDIMHVSNGLEIWSQALKVKEDPALRKALANGLAFVAGAETLTTQDQAFKIMTLARYGSEAQKKLSRQLALKLEQEQLPDGGWSLEPDPRAVSSPFATGQVLYAFRLAGINPNAAVFRRGVMYLITTQEPEGSWHDPVLSSRFAATMWPVIGLAGAFGSKVEPGHILVTALPRPIAAPVPTPVVAKTAVVETVASTAPALPNTIEFVLDCSLSMLDRLGKSTRILTAKQVMRDLIKQLPDDANVGLRLYGHRYESMSSKSWTDTQLVVPIGPLNRPALLAVIDAAEARGQTPLVFSTLQAGDDLKRAGGGTIIVVTDGEESCGGKPRKAGPQLAALGVPLRLDIIGFTLAGKRVVDDLTAFTSATGGRYYTAADGAALSQALHEAISPAPRPAPPVVVEPPTPPPAPLVEDFPYEIFDQKGVKLASSSTLSADVPDLEPGLYRVVLHDGAKQAVIPTLKLETSETLELSYSPSTATLTVKK